MAKKYKHFKKQTRIPLKLNIEKNSCRQKRTTNEQFVQNSVHTDMKSTKEAIFQKRPQNQSIRGVKTLWNPIANVSVKIQYEETSI